MKSEFYSEICCDYCNEVIHNHFDCPVCKKEYAGTSMYHEIDPSWDEIFHCESCKAEFKLLGRNEEDWNVWNLEQISKNRQE